MNHIEMLNYIYSYENAVISIKQYNACTIGHYIKGLIEFRNKLYSNLTPPEFSQQEIEQVTSEETCKYIAFLGKMLCKKLSNSQFETMLRLMSNAYLKTKEIDKNGKILQQFNSSIDSVKQNLVNNPTTMTNYRLRDIAKTKKIIDNQSGLSKV